MHQIFLSPDYSYFPSGTHLKASEPSVNHLHKLTLEDVASSLDNLSRYNGNRNFSVLRHTLLLLATYKLFEQSTIDEQKWILIHDVAEIITGEIARPISALNPKIKQLEHKWDAAIVKFHKLNIIEFSFAKLLDKSLPIIEIMVTDLHEASYNWDEDKFPLGQVLTTSGALDLAKWIRDLSPVEAQKMYMQEYKSLFADKAWK